MPRWTSFARFLLFLLIAVPAEAHDAVVSTRSAQDSARFDIRPSVVLGDSWDDVHTARLLVRTAGHQQRLQVEDASEGGAVAWRTNADSCALLVADLGPKSDRARPDGWRRLTHASKQLLCPGEPIASDALPAWLTMRRRAGALTTAKTGSRVEIRPLFNLATLRAGRDLAVRIYRDGEAHAGATVHAEGPGGQKRTAQADGAGIAILRIASAGAWRIRYRTTLDGRATQATVAFEVVADAIWDAARGAGSAQ